MSTYVIFGGTGSLAKALIKAIPKQYNNIIAFSRCEEKHVNLKALFPDRDIYSWIGDIRDYNSVYDCLNYNKPDITIHCAALKNVPECEAFPSEAIKTNITGTENIVNAITRLNLKGKHCFISTDKATSPINSYGMTKAIAERVWLLGNSDRAIFNVCRYGNVLESRGSVIPLFKQKIIEGKKLSITDVEMTRFLMSLPDAVNLIFQTLSDSFGGKVFIPKIKSTKIVDLADVLIEHYDKNIEKDIVGIRPGEKKHEILYSDQEIFRTQKLKDKFVIHDINSKSNFKDVNKEYSSGDPENLMTKEELKQFLIEKGVL